MKTTTTVASPASLKVDTLTVLVCSLKSKLPWPLTELDTLAGGAIARAVKSRNFSGAQDQSLVLFPPKGPTRIMLIGMGEVPCLDRRSIRHGAGVAARSVTTSGGGSLAIAVASHVPRRTFPNSDIARQLVEGVSEGAWIFEELRSAPDVERAVTSLTLVTTASVKADWDQGRRHGVAVAAGQNLARNLQMLPGNHCPPSHMASVARRLGRAHGCKVTVLRRTQLERDGMHALLAVAQGSVQEPHLIAIEYRGAGRDAPICLVGKGVTFDSGGISLKPALNMEDMKFDMSGAAAVLGAFEVIGRLKPKINVVGIVPTTENLPSGTAVKPGDVIKTHLGKTVEVINTDAEGRLILSDALSYARRFKPSCIIDAATLTGAVVVGLGHHATGVMGNNDPLVDELCAVGDHVAERCWPLPLWDAYRPQIKSEVADIKNTGGRPAGSITAGWFLREFVEDDMPWAHLDIAGTAYGDATPGRIKGPTGVGVRLFSEFVLRRAGG